MSRTAPAACHVLLDCTQRSAPPADAGEIRLFSKLRNERLRLPAFLQHYRSLGVARFFLVDNGSTDGSREYLQAQTDVHLFRTEGRFSEAKGGTEWLNALLGEFGVGAWCVTVDVDELLWFPGSEASDLHQLTSYFDRKGYEAFSCLLLDLYPGGPLRSCTYAPGDDLTRVAPYFDAGPYIWTKPREGRTPGCGIFGGVRGRVFYPEARKKPLDWKLRYLVFTLLPSRVPLLRDSALLRRHQPKTSPVLAKAPLVRWDHQSRYLDAHSVTPKPTAPETGVLLHFKFLQDFHERAVKEAARGEYFDGASEYRKYCEKLKSDPDLSFIYEGSTRFESSEQLVRLGLMHDSDAWARERNRRQAETEQEMHERPRVHQVTQ